MPFLILNLGVEMIYVLHSRLRAQAVPADKAEGVMRDIGTNLFSSAFVSELFTPQPLYTPASVMQVFATLSTSSVMHLSENSMKKLCDLVFMTVKYQTLTLRHPLELYELTLNHLDTVLELLPPPVHGLVQDAMARLHGLASTFYMGDWATVRRTVLNFFGGRHVRVSVFLDNGVQDVATGAFKIPRDVYLTPLPSCLPPGLISFYTKLTAASFEHPDARLPYPPSIPVRSWDPKQRAMRMTTNGFDMYAASTSSSASPGTRNFSDPLGRQTREMPLPRSAQSSHGGAALSTNAQALSHAEKQRAYDAEVNYLASIAGTGHRAPGVHTFELELFEDAASSSPTSSASMPASAGQSVKAAAAPNLSDTPAVAVPLSRMTASAVQAQNQQLLGILRDFDGAKSDSYVGDASATTKTAGVNDLLDIMDEI